MIYVHPRLLGAAPKKKTWEGVKVEIPCYPIVTQKSSNQKNKKFKLCSMYEKVDRMTSRENSFESWWYFCFREKCKMINHNRNDLYKSIRMFGRGSVPFCVSERSVKWISVTWTLIWLNLKKNKTFRYFPLFYSLKRGASTEHVFRICA